jgi:hypothetical protein
MNIITIIIIIIIVVVVIILNLQGKWYKCPRVSST